MDKKDLIKFNKRIEETIKLIGTSKINYLPSERISRRNARRSIYTKCEILKGNIIHKEDLICKRPCRGIEPKFYENLIGKKIKKSLKEDVHLKWSYF